MNNPTLQSHTHYQVAQANTQAKTWQRVCLSQRTTDRQADEEKEALGGNRRLAQWRVTWLIEHSTSHQHLWYIDSFVLRNPPLRQAPNRWQQWTNNKTLHQVPFRNGMIVSLK